MYRPGGGLQSGGHPFDEAISSLDAHTQVQVMDLLRELKEKLGLTYVFITHDLTSITYLCDDVLFFTRGV